MFGSRKPKVESKTTYDWVDTAPVAATTPAPVMELEREPEPEPVVDTTPKFQYPVRPCPEFQDISSGVKIPSEYDEMLAELNIGHLAFETRNQMILDDSYSWFLDNGIQTINNAKVIEYLTEYCETKANEANEANEHLTERDRQYGRWEQWSYRFVPLENYTNPIPIEILRNVKRIKDSSFWNSERFALYDENDQVVPFNINHMLYVSEIYSRKIDPDPFIAVYIPKTVVYAAGDRSNGGMEQKNIHHNKRKHNAWDNGRFVFFGVWDEPGFSLTK